MKRALLGLLVVGISLGLAPAAMAGQNANAGITLHITKPTTKRATCASFSFKENNNSDNRFDTKGTPCTNGQGDFDVWVVVCNGSDSLGVAGVEYGIDYDGADGSGVDVNYWTLCGDLEFDATNYPAAGGSNIVTWVAPENCQLTNAGNNKFIRNTVYAVAGVFGVSAYGQDEMRIIPRPVSGRLKVADCLAREDDLTDKAEPRGGIAVFCTPNRKGYTYCDSRSLGTEETTWGAIKTLYKD